MRGFTNTPSLLLLALNFLFTNLAVADVKASNLETDSSPFNDHFNRGAFEASLGAGALFSPFIATHNRPTLNYQLTEFQIGYMLTPVRGSGFWRGNVEVAGSAFGGPIFSGVGHYVTGGTLWGRYNFVPQHGHFVPFVQIGAGLTTTDLDRRIEGQDFNFNLNVGVGTRYFINPNWTVNLEYRFQHISNANLSSRNIAVNAEGLNFGVSYFF